MNRKFIENIFPIPSIDHTTKPTLLTFQAPETLTLNLDSKTSLADIELTKLLNLKDLADQIPDNFYSNPRVLQNPLPGRGNVLPAKRSTLVTPKSVKM